MSSRVPSIDAVLLIAFGGPERAEDVRPFLDNVLRGRPVPPARYEEVVQHYEQVGGRSPLNELTRRQAEGLRADLAARGPALPIYVGMRNWHPLLADTLAQMAEDGVRRAVGIILAPHRTEASGERYTGAIAAAQEALGARAPQVDYVSDWFDDPLFVATMASRVQEAMQTLGGDGRAPVHLLFTAHSVPRAMGGAERYVSEYEATGRLVAARLGEMPHTFAYQSRSGSPRDPWLEPDVNDALRACAADGVSRVVVAPIGFVCDHVEVLYDLDVEARATAAALGIACARARTANDHPSFVRLLGELVRRRTHAR